MGNNINPLLIFLIILIWVGIGYIIALLLGKEKDPLNLLARFMVILFWPILVIFYILTGSEILEKEERKK